MLSNHDQCDCGLPECDECAERAVEKMNDDDKNNLHASVEQHEANILQRLDDDDYDEEDIHGSHPIDELDVDEDDE